MVSVKEEDPKLEATGSEKTATKVQFVDVANPSLVKDKIDLDNVVLTDK